MAGQLSATRPCGGAAFVSRSNPHPRASTTAGHAPRSNVRAVGRSSRLVPCAQEGSVAEVAEKPTSARSEGLALMLDDGTRKSHSMAENSAFVSGFFRGIAEKDQFAQLVASLYFVYKAMEDAFDTTENENVRALDYSALRRLESLERDMEYYYGAEWRDTVKPTAATKQYVARISEVAKSDPELLIAHQYTRYLGDLFGGQMMGGMATRSLNLVDGKGIEFYQFDDIPDVKAFIEDWYGKLNALDISAEKKEQIVDEANKVFSLNILIFDELDGNALAVVLKLAVSALKEKLGFN